MNEAFRLQAGLAEVLAAKDERAAAQSELRQRHGLPVVSITVNITGSVKYSVETINLLCDVLNKVRGRFVSAGFAIKEERLLHCTGGPAAICAVSGSAVGLKKIAVDIEERLSYGRLADIDVFDINGRHIGRADLNMPPRTCLLCGRPAAICVRSVAHDRKDVLAEMQKLLACHHADRTAVWPPQVHAVGTLALEAMLMEVACTPAPGLVDMNNSGAHSDMDIFTFLKSSSALAPSIYRCALAGFEHFGSPEDLLPILRRIGLEGEKNMFRATDGVNTQKGLLFLMGVLAGATGRVLRTIKEPKASDIAELAGSICHHIVERELAGLGSRQNDGCLTAGEKLYLQNGITGIRGEMASGLPSVIKTGLPAFCLAVESGLPLNDALVHALIALMTVTQDTTIVNRHGMDVLREVQNDAAGILAVGGMMNKRGRLLIKNLDKKYIRRNISPGGAADLLAATYFLCMMETRFAAK